MKKSCVFLFVMSLILLLLAALRIVEFINILHMYSLHNELKELYTMYGSTGSNDYYIFRKRIFVSAINIAVYLVPGILGIIGSIKRGRFTVVCIVLGGLLALYVILKSLVHMLQGVSISVVSYGCAFVCFALYTAAAAVAFKFRKTA